MGKASVGRPPTPPAGLLSRLTADAINVQLHRSGLSAKALYEGAGMSAATYYARMSGRLSLTLNDIEAFSKVLGVTPADIQRMATALGELTPRMMGDRR